MQLLRVAINQSSEDAQGERQPAAPTDESCHVRSVQHGPRVLDQTTAEQQKVTLPHTRQSAPHRAGVSRRRQAPPGTSCHGADAATRRVPHSCSAGHVPQSRSCVGGRAAGSEAEECRAPRLLSAKRCHQESGSEHEATCRRAGTAPSFPCRPYRVPRVCWQRRGLRVLPGEARTAAAAPRPLHLVLAGGSLGAAEHQRAQVAGALSDREHRLRGVPLLFGLPAFETATCCAGFRVVLSTPPCLQPELRWGQLARSVASLLCR
eukprot:scaffold23787_cov73-Phaeocystis_antarctica.AAC.2